ncbi:hypothetical protein E2C01_033361 [Portunus trituberculatus]|uniref:Uncharacterized protein n=1 Tax=Portunus trituberculatus TaxID=210409 RepID=A0A5B7EZY1_PORTR|nr:hypothetical protein [Portunus trituberculatus]
MVPTDGGSLPGAQSQQVVGRHMSQKFMQMEWGVPVDLMHHTMMLQAAPWKRQSCKVEAPHGLSHWQRERVEEGITFDPAERCLELTTARALPCPIRS